MRTLKSLAFLSLVGLFAGCLSHPSSSDESEPTPALSTVGAAAFGPIFLHQYRDDVTDGTGNGHDGIVKGNPVFRNSCLDRGLVFDGVDDLIRVPAHDDLQPQQVTLEVYFRPLDVLQDGDGFLPIVVKLHAWRNFWNAADGYDMWYQDSGGGGRIGFGVAHADGNWRANASWTGTLRPNKYYHAVGTYDGSEIRFYLNGELMDVVPHSAPIAYLDGPIRIGGRVFHSYYHPSDYHYFGGKIDEVAIYDYALKPWQVRLRALRCPRVETDGDGELPERHEAGD